MKFNYVVGNPPFQDNKNRGKTQHKLWIEFTLNSFNDFLADDGKMIWITPSSWGSPSNKILKLFKQTHVSDIYLDIDEYFPKIGSTFSFYVLDKGASKTSTNIHSNEKISKLVLDDSIPYFPNDFNEISLSIHKKVFFDSKGTLETKHDYVTCHNVIRHKKKILSKKIDELNKRLSCEVSSAKRNSLSEMIHKKKKELSEAFITVSEKKTSQHVYPILHTNKKIWYSSIKQSFADNKKVMWSRSGYTKPFYDDGNLGCTDMGYYIEVVGEEQGRNLESFLTSKLMAYIFRTAKWSGFGNELVFNGIPKIDLTNKLTDQQIFDLFNLTEEEVSYIENGVKKKKQKRNLSSQTKNEKRIKELGEVFTPKQLVEQTLEHVREQDWQNRETTFLDPACGNGNFLVEILEKKIKNGNSVLQALQTTYGVDIMSDNVRECRKRLFEVGLKYDKAPTKEWKAALLTNIRVANTLENTLEEIFNAPLTDDT